MRVPGSDKAIVNLVKWSTKANWAPYRDQVFAEHLGSIYERFESSDEKIRKLLGESFGIIFGFILEDFFSARFGDDGEINIVDDYLKRRGWRETVSAKRYLEALRDSTPSLYEVVDLDPGHGMTVRDLILGGEPVTVEEKLGSETAARWDRLAGRIIIVNKKPYFTASLLLLSHDVAEEAISTFAVMTKRIKKKLKREAKNQNVSEPINDRDVKEMIIRGSVIARLFSQAWLIDTLDHVLAPIPEIRNSDGDDIVFSETHFPVTSDMAAVARALDGIDGFDRNDTNELHWTWHGYGSPSQRMSGNDDLTLKSKDNVGRTVLGNVEVAGDALVLSTNSTQRAERARDLLASHLGALVGRPLTSYQDLETVLEENPGSVPAEPNLPPEVAEQVIHSYLEDHYRQALNDPLPIFDGKTPRQAVKTKKGRAQVVDWLKRLENSEYRRAAGQDQKPYDMGWMWRELKIEDAG